MHSRLPKTRWLRIASLVLALGCWDDATTSSAQSDELSKHPSTSKTVSALPPDSKTETHQHTNRLINEKSPYLLQHAHNPVNWYPWSDEAFEKARKENKPVFLSIGYSTCHWCHVMERESFENDEIAGYLNEHFVSIKVDREERPDIDKIYMTYVQATTGSGGWPMSVFATSERKPFYGGTYFPPKGKFGRPGFLELLQRINELWTTRHDDILASADKMLEQIESHMVKESEQKPKLNADILREAVMQIKRGYDPVNGGFGQAPKFPTPAVPVFVLRYGVRHGDQELIDMIKTTGDHMAAGGIYDQLGGGFSRYSVDATWLVPHFEKMLYDNAQLLDLYLDLYQVTGEQRYAAVARDIIRYVLRDMTNDGGGFYSAEDADSEGYEGKFYVWTKVELKQILSPDEFTVVNRYYGITEKGNFVDHSHPNPIPDQNVLSIADPKLTEAERTLLTSANRKMMDERATRIRPRLDDKVLASWNGLMLGPVARAAVILKEPNYREVAEKNLGFLKSNLWDESSKTLYHRWRDGARDEVQLLDGYANLLNGVVQLYETTLETKHLEFAIKLADAMIKRFYDAANGGFWQTTEDASDLIIRVKEDYDGAQPSGNSVAILALLKLGDITGESRFKNSGEKSLQFFADRMDRSPYGAAYMLQALDYWLDVPSRVVINNDPGSEKVRELLYAVYSVYQPTKVVLSNKGPVEELARSINDRGEPEAYICTGQTCKPPTTDPKKIQQMLRNSNELKGSSTK